ncbi:MAG: inorganic phosphate transporter [Desulfobacterales bacterium]|jgi:PiT family inorganic phosphate transporter|nr:inorganic phosphate transporter [Desulfobacteraceae bacterium]MDY0311234.1 inorganic phosphate transporter [Desulfobacterales bacterium]
MWKIGSGIFLGWALGANASANIFGTGVATGTVRYRTAIWLTAICLMAGAVLEGPKCMQTLGELSLLIPLEAFCVALAAGVTMAVLTVLALPASASQAIVGAILGAGLLAGTADFSRLYRIVACWVFTPVCALVLGYLLHRGIGWLLDRTVRGLTCRNYIYLAGILVSGCYGAYSLGANNVANVTGVYVGAGLLSAQTAALVGGLSIAFGVLTYSRRVMMTVGKGIVPLDPFSAMVVALAHAMTLHLFTQVGVPVSSSQAVVGSVVGVGLMGDMHTISARMLLKIAVGWIGTPLAAGLMTVALIWGIDAAIPFWQYHVGPMLERLGIREAIPVAVQFYGEWLRRMMNALGW